MVENILHDIYFSLMCLTVKHVDFTPTVKAVCFINYNIYNFLFSNRDIRMEPNIDQNFR